MAKNSKNRKKFLNEPDKFLTFTNKMLSFTIENKVIISVTVGVIIALIIGTSGFLYFSDKAENKAFAMLQQSITKYETIMKDKGPEEAYQKVEKDFQMILKKYSGKDGGKLARVIYANICFDGGDSDKAIDLYSKALRDFDGNWSLKNLILSRLGYAYGEKKDYKTAVKYFEMIASGSDPFMKDDALFNLGMFYAEMGDTDKSMEAFKKVADDHPDSIYLELVKEKVLG